MNDANPVSGALPTPWREALSPAVPWKARSAFVETRVRYLLAGLAPGEVLSTAELVERLFPVGAVQSPEDTGARQELFLRVGKLGANTPLALKMPTVVEKGWNKGRTINRLLWRRIEAAAMPSPAYAPSDPDLADIRSRLTEIEAQLAAVALELETLRSTKD